MLPGAESIKKINYKLMLQKKCAGMISYMSFHSKDAFVSLVVLRDP